MRCALDMSGPAFEASISGWRRSFCAASVRSNNVRPMRSAYRDAIDSVQNTEHRIQNTASIQPPRVMAHPLGGGEWFTLYAVTPWHLSEEHGANGTGWLHDCRNGAQRLRSVRTTRVTFAVVHRNPWSRRIRSSTGTGFGLS